MRLKIVLLQARNPGDTAKDEERQLFADKCGLDLTHMVPFDLLSAAPTWADLHPFDAVMVGGSGDYYVSKGNLPHMPATLEALREVVAQGKPMFASCFGFQLVVQALGGNVIYDPDNLEVGTFGLSLTEAGQHDELFGDLPPRFMAQLGRKDRAEFLPQGVIHVAGSERCPYQALRIPHQPIWAAQFHPELSRTDNLARFERYQQGYAAMMSETEVEAARAGFTESPETEQLLRRFIRLVFG